LDTKDPTSSAIDAAMDSTPKKLQLKSHVGLMGGVSLVVGIMIGSGIFISPQTVLLKIGSPGAGLVIWACCGLLTVLASLSYAELGTVIRESGGTYMYILQASGNLMAFLFAFTYVLVLRPGGSAAQALVFAKNIVAPFYQDCPPPVVVVKTVAAGGILLVAIVNCLSVRFTVYLMATKLFALVVIVIGGMLVLIQGNTCPTPIG
uniref:Zmp:0000001267 n=1 Tax=Astyanax mexicanus TaxID=7994 RepID=A0A8B9R7Y2_ASTMX